MGTEPPPSYGPLLVALALAGGNLPYPADSEDTAGVGAIVIGRQQMKRTAPEIEK